MTIYCYTPTQQDWAYQTPTTYIVHEHLPPHGNDKRAQKHTVSLHTPLPFLSSIPHSIPNTTPPTYPPPSPPSPPSPASPYPNAPPSPSPNPLNPPTASNIPAGSLTAAKLIPAPSST
ncbi:hypothetical protein M427DRAFT_57236 [Gonapodya prolifera JEL478]|uniref:Uncharacterized protein n=1 Tax=Gonapodya prolifera (strain JEL478) TaxID=1344416 RepID=A0A139AEG5_GONPJ|nr:hypothetical protein M427DRAFT_57236 [Gonapodya prolifera JEL478]|eukprot:KXS14835.1 hypothetical protein M427DRAFT_57236 [Gonapodya prolifera JEL478]